MHPTQLPSKVLEPLLIRRGRLHAFEAIEPKKTALIVIDMQNVFCAPGAVIEVPMARDIVPNINRLARKTRAAGGLVVWMQMTLRHHDEWAVALDNLFAPGLGERMLEGLNPAGEGHALWPAMETDTGDIYMFKTRFSAFLPSASDLGRELRERGIDTVLITGTNTNVCCESSARDASMMDFKTIMISDANAALTDEAHMTTLITFVQNFGDVRSVDEAVQMLFPANDVRPHPAAPQRSRREF